MGYVLIPLLLILMGMTVFSLFRGLNAFRQELDANVDPEGARELQLKQNKMMWMRIWFQAGAVVVVALIMMIAR